MTQLIIDGVVLPESQGGTYTAQKQPLYTEVQMASGRLVRELRGNVWVITYQYGFFDDQMKNAVISACEKGINTPVRCGFLPQESVGELTYSDFFVTSFSRPKFMWSRDSGGKTIPMWADFVLELREVRPSD